MKRLLLLTITFLFIPNAVNCTEEMHLETYKGVVTYHLIPAKVIKINKIIENPTPGTSYIGDEGILLDVDENPNVMANWTVVEVRYYEYHQPKTIKYKIMSEQYEMTVKYHAVSVMIAGDMSSYTNGP